MIQKKLRYSIEEKGIVVISQNSAGQNENLIPYHRISKVIIRRDLLDRMFGISQLVINGVKIPGIDQAHAECLKKLISEKISQTRISELPEVDYSKIDKSKWIQIYKNSAGWDFIFILFYIPWILFFLLITAGLIYAIFNDFSRIAKYLTATSEDAKLDILYYIRKNLFGTLLGIPGVIWLLYIFWKSFIGEIADWFSTAKVYHGNIENMNSYIGRHNINHHYIGGGGWEWQVGKGVYWQVRMNQEIIAVFNIACVV